MINHLLASNHTRGFTLLETVIYLALFSILFTGILVSSHSFFRGAELMSALLVRENETAFVVRKIGTLLNSAKEITSPVSGSASSTLIFSTYDGGEYTFTIKDEKMMYASGTNPFIPLTADRVVVTSFTATLSPKIGVSPLFLDYSFAVEGEVVGLIRTYFTF